MEPAKSNPAILASALDDGLDHEVELIVYGRAAIALGFDDPPAEVLHTLDIDAIIRAETIAALEADDNFWTARDTVNERFKDKGLYITHLFGEDQVFLRRGWADHIVPIHRPETKWLKLFRPASIDLVLTKMMRGDDPQDMDDAEFLIRHDRISPTQLHDAFATANLTDIVELHDAFERAKPRILQFAERTA